MGGFKLGVALCLLLQSQLMGFGVLIQQDLVPPQTAPWERSEPPLAGLTRELRRLKETIDSALGMSRCLGHPRVDDQAIRQAATSPGAMLAPSLSMLCCRLPGLR